MNAHTGTCSICGGTVVLGSRPHRRLTSSGEQIVMRKQRAETHQDSCLEAFRAQIRERAKSVELWPHRAS